MRNFFRHKPREVVNPPKQTVAELVKLLEAAKAEEAATSEADKGVVYKRAVLIGINYFGTSSELNGCVNDVHNVYVWLTKECGYDAKNIQILTDERDSAVRPTRANIEKAMKWLNSDLPANVPVQLFLHYSGHGSWTYDQSAGTAGAGDEADGRDESICPVDYNTAGCIIDDDLNKLIVVPIAEMANVSMTCLFDCCHSGTALDLRYDYEIDVNGATPTTRTYKMIQQKSLQKTKSQIMLWSGCLDSQTSADAYIARQSQGAMTWGFLSTVRKNKNVLSYKKLLSELQLQLKSARYEQIPHFSCSKMVNLADRAVLF
jgi:hypothetical protein